MPDAKEGRLSLRVTPYQKMVLARAAALRQTTLTGFIVEKAYEAAREVLADQFHFTLDEARWNEFCAALDAPPKEIPALRKLLSEPSVFDE